LSRGSIIKVPFGPQHPALKEPENFLFEVDGETVVDVKPRLGYNHRGMEKAFELKTYIQNIYLAERICGICSDAHTTCYTQAIEELLGVEPPPRARYIRVIIAELERIQSHTLWVGLAAHEIGFSTLFMYVWRDRETVLDMFEMISGNRILKRAAGVGILRPKDAASLCAVGPTSRASGIKNDVRSDDPYVAYDEIPFNVVTRDGCDVLSRMLVRCEETLESIKIIRLALNSMPDGIIVVKVPKKIPRGEVVSRVEAPRGELIHYIKSNGTTKPERYKVRSPTLANIPALCKMLRGGYVADIPIVLAGIDPCFSCMDRMAFVDTKKNEKWVWTMQQLRRKNIKG